MLLFGFALTKAAQVRRRPPEVGTHRLVGVTGHVRGDGLVFVDGELWHAQTADGSRLGLGEQVVVEAVDQEGLRLVVGSAQPARPSPPKGRDPLIGLIVVAAVALIVLMFLFAIKVARGTSAASSSGSAGCCPSRRGRVSSCSSP